LSGIHANIQAFDACLAHARVQGAQQFALLGDLVGYGANPVEVVARVQELATSGALVLKGNHDEMAVWRRLWSLMPRATMSASSSWVRPRMVC
jgi:hypothetical protein